MNAFHHRLRTKTGAGIAVITLMIGTLLISSLGLFTFEMLRHNTAYDELRSSCESAALAGAAAMASSDNPNTASSRALARKAAQDAFRFNSIVGVSLGSADLTAMNSGNFPTYAPPPNGSAMFIEFVDPETGNVINDDNNPAGRIVRVYGAFTNEPPFGKFLGIPAVPMRTKADSSVPQLDVVMCFDTSGSIDDQTPVTLVARLDGGGGKNKYQVMGSDTIYNLMKPGPTGTGFCAYPPQALNSTSNGWSFDTAMRGTSSKNDALPPSYTSVSGKRFSDCVVNIDGNKVFGGMSISSGGITFDFPDVGTLVEAARGNLENNSVFISSRASASLPSSVTPKAGYQAAYLNAALNQTQPISAARSAAIQFFQIMNNNTSAHFGFVSFSTKGHKNVTDNESDWSIASNYQTTKQKVMEPGIALDKSNDNFTTIISQCVPPTQAYGNTNFADSLSLAVDMLKTSNGQVRKGSKKAILFFTDGQPTTGGSWSSAAATAKDEGIQIYTVGLAQNAAIVPGECENLNAGAGQAVTYTDPDSGATMSYTPSGNGMAASGASGGKFFLVVNSANLRYVFENIARSLVQLVKT